ncbi:MAG: sialidase family protein [Bacteroidota bacterium]
MRDDCCAFKVGVGVFKSDDAGTTWVKSSGGLATPYMVDIFMDSGGKVYVLYDASIYSSADNGNTWTLLANTGFSSAGRYGARTKRQSFHCITVLRQ